MTNAQEESTSGEPPQWWYAALIPIVGAAAITLLGALGNPENMRRYVRRPEVIQNQRGEFIVRVPKTGGGEDDLDIICDNEREANQVKFLLDTESEKRVSAKKEEYTRKYESQPYPKEKPTLNDYLDNARCVERRNVSQEIIIRKPDGYYVNKNSFEERLKELMRSNR